MDTQPEIDNVMESHKPVQVTVDILHNRAFDTKKRVAKPTSSNITRRQQHFWRKTGIYAFCVLVFGTVALLFALGSITFLWKGLNATTTYNGSTMAVLWRTIMMKAWISRAITLLSLVIRVAITAQAGVCTSMLAALLLECSSIPVPWIAEVSLIRSITSGPHHLAFSVLEAFPRIRGPVVIPILSAIVFTTLLSQFCSTVLLSDLEPGMIITGATVAPIRYGMPYNPDWPFTRKGVAYWATKPPSYPAFAEYSEPSGQTNESFYTGKAYRAMLPFSEPLQRSLIHAYSGIATVALLETVCARPSIQANIVTGARAPMFVGNISGSPPTQFVQDNPIFTPTNQSFNCTIPIFWGGKKELRYSKEWTVGICRLSIENYPERDTFLMLNLTKGNALKFETSRNRTLYNATYDYADRMWQHIKSPTTPLALSASLCWAGYSTELLYVDISSDVSRTEPTLGWNLVNASYDSTAIRTQLGTLLSTNRKQPTFQERNILSLNHIPNWNTTEYTARLALEREAIRGGFAVNVTAGMCVDCTINEDYPAPSFGVHRAQIAVFQEILISTSNPALALQAQYFTLLQMAHYDLLPEMELIAPATISFFKEVLMPTSWNGYISVAVVIAVHLACMMLTVGLFLAQTRFTLLGNTWSAVAQITRSGTASASVAATAVMKTDSEIRRRIKQDTSTFRLQN